MKNRYFGLRHGESAANVAGIVVSAPAIGTVEYGLTDHGKEQVAASVSLSTELGPETVIVCSDFLRALETATIASDILACASPTVDERLRERYFGQWDMQENTNYDRVWALDEADPNHCLGDVESITGVCTRLRALVESIEQEFSNKAILLVSHGDPLQLLQTVFEGRSPCEHRSLEPWRTAEIRKLVSTLA